MLETRNITKVYKEGQIEVVAVDSVSLSLTKGKLLLIMGPSGSGKTTLLSMMGCILRPTSGQIVVDGKMMSNLSEDKLPEIRKRYFGFTFQSFNLFPSLNACENIELVLRLKGKRNNLKSEALRLLDIVGLSKRSYFYPKDLSGGEKQRVAIARALACEPKIILADEPTANLDSKTGLQVLSLLKGLACDLEKVVVVVSHDPKVEPLADEIVFLEDGRIK
ncbi:MAG: ABC transporter ATP-binding protein [bacterium]